MSELIGKELGPYRILEQIGVGGMATVYKAYHAAMDRYVAIKVLPPQMGANAELRSRFQREAKVIARLEHAHILPVYDYGQAGNLLYLAMRYVEAGTLKHRIATAPMDLSEVNRVMQQVGGALDYAHRLGVVHRDIKPTNVLLDAEGDCYLTDFGLAKVMEASIRLTATGVGIGTPAYMSPEQGQGDPADARSDVYSLGVMLYEMVTGGLPYEAETPLAVVLKHISAPLPLPRDVNPEVPEAVERVILRAMAKNPGDRFRTVEEMMAALDAAVRGTERTDIPLPPARGRAARPRWGSIALWGGIGVVAVTVLALLLAWGLPALQGRRQERMTATAIAALMLTPTATSLLTETGTATATATATHTPVPTATPPPTVPAATQTSTPSASPTFTPTPMPTDTATAVQTSTPTATAAATPTASRTPTVTPTPTLTHTPTPSPAERARAFAEPILAAIADRPPDYQDDFSNPGSGWMIQTSDRGQVGYKDGKYFVLSTDPSSAYGDWEGPWFADFVLEVDIRHVSGEGAEDGWFLVLRDWRDPNPGPHGFYALEGRPNSGVLHLWKHVDDDDRPSNLFGYLSPRINAGYSTNHVLVVLKGPWIAVYVNSRPVGLGYDELFRQGTVGLATGTQSDTPMEVHYDNLKIWDISGLP